MNATGSLDPRHIPALDGLRGFAILLVFYYHTCGGPTHPTQGLFLANLGWTGVDLFFVLSGFLITGILRKSRNALNFYGAFYARRILRIAPVYYLGLLAAFFLQPALYMVMHHRATAELPTLLQQSLYWINLSNLRSAFFPLEIPLVSVYWSLAIEEQFYFLWPTIVRHIRPRMLSFLCLGAMLLMPVLRALPFVQQTNLTYANFIYRFTPFHLDGLLFGAFLALYLERQRSQRELRKLTRLCFFSGLFLMTLAMHLHLAAAPPMTTIAYTALAIFFGGILLACASPQGGPEKLVARIFSIPLLTRFGRYSYFIYVFHTLILYSIGHVLERITRSFNPLAQTYISALIALAVCYGLAALSWRWMEAPILSRKRRFPYRFRAATGQVIEQEPVPLSPRAMQP